MNKRLLSMFLMLCMVLTMLPVSAMAKEVHTTIGGDGEIIAFAPLKKTEKIVPTGTSIRNLDLPETLTATVRTDVIAGEEPGLDFGDSEWVESTVDIPVTWTSQPGYDMDTEGDYVFTPVIEGYTVSAVLPKIKVTVGAAMPQGMVSSLAITYYDIWVGSVQVNEVNKNNIRGTNITGTITYDSESNTLTLNEASIPESANYSSDHGRYGIYSYGQLNIVLEGVNTVTAGAYTDNESIAIRVAEGSLTISGNGSLTATGGRVSSTANYASIGIAAKGLTINSGTVVARGGTVPFNLSYGIYSNGKLTFNGGTITARGNNQAIGTSVPDLNGYANVQISASAASSQGTDATVITKETLASSGITSYKYLKFEQGVSGVAQIGNVGYATLSEAVTTVTDGGTIKLLKDTKENIDIGSSDTRSFTLDLSGKTLDGGNYPAIKHWGSGTLTIKDTASAGGGKITSARTWDQFCTIDLRGGSLVVESGTVQNTETNSTIAIYNKGGIVSITGGVVTSPFAGIYNMYGWYGEVYRAGSVSVSDGVVECTAMGYAIFNYDSSNVSVSGGIVRSKDSIAIANNLDGKITIGGTAHITSECSNTSWGTIWLLGERITKTVLEITGGTIENTATGGNAIYSKGTGKILVTGGTSVISGDGMAMNTAPDLSEYTKVQVAASANYDGSSPVAEYKSVDINTYKHLTFEQSTGTTVTDLALADKLLAPVIGGTPETTVTDDQYTGTVSWSGSPTKFLGNTAYTATVVLTANADYTFSGVAKNALTHTGASSVTHELGTGKVLTLTIKFPATAAKALQSIIITTPPSKTAYKYGETFSPDGMVVKATYNDGTENANFTDYTVDKTGALNMSDTTVTLTANGTSITITQSITINKTDGPGAPIDLAGIEPTSNGGLDGKITGTTALMEYANNIGFTGALDCTATETIGLVAGTYYVRVKATETHEAGAYTVVTIPEGVTKLAVPTGVTGLKWTGTEQTGVNDGMGYTLSGKYQATDVGSYTATATLQSGYAWNDNTTEPITIAWSIAKADGPGAPIDLAGVEPTSNGGSDGKITGTTNLMEYANNMEFTDASDCSPTETTGLAAGTYYVRVKATETHEAGAYTTVIVPGRFTIIAVPTGVTGLKWTGSDQTGVNSGTGYMLSGQYQATAVGSYTAIATLESGYVWDDNTTEPKIIAWSIAKADGLAVTGVSAVNCTTVDNNDGMLIGVTTAMEYKNISDASYTTVSGSAISVSGSAITGLTNGEYLVRVAETDTHNAGPDSLFTVGSFIPEPTYTITGTISGSDTNSAIVGAVVQLKSGGNNIGSSVFTDSSGTYAISNVPAGTYTIEVSTAGYDSGTISNIVVSSETVTGKDLTLTKTITFIPVTDITLTNTSSVQVNTDLTLAGTVSPDTSTNRTITWSVESANNTGATINGNTFRATSAGTATVKATVANGLGVGSDYTKTFTITVTAAPIYVPDPTPSYPVDNTKKPEGKVEKTEQADVGAPAVNVTNSSDELKSSVLTPEEQERVAKGENAKVVLKVTDISASVGEEEKKLIEEKLALENGNADISVLYVDLSLYKQIGNQEQIQVTETKGKIKISIEVPESLRNTDVTKNRVFYIIRIHDKEATRIEGSYDPVTHLFTFETDRFSTYALTYQDASKIQTYHGFHHLQLTAKAYKTSQTLSYQRVANVDGYLIYGAKCGNEMKELAKVSADTTSYTVKGLKQGTYYKYQVKAYRIIDGEQVIIMSSKVIHSITESKTYGNPTKVTSKTASITLAKGKSKTVTCQVVLPKGKKQKEHTAVIRYESSDKAIATVNSQGKITAKAKGSCYVYAYAQNGVYKRFKVTVES